MHHASRDEPQYEIKSDKTDHVALHKGMALRRLRRKSTASDGCPQRLSAERNNLEVLRPRTACSSAFASSWAYL
ncbi:MAG TPA: DUF2945 domain-containing protein [Steroidobacteraceae bacterium]